MDASPGITLGVLTPTEARERYGQIGGLCQNGTEHESVLNAMSLFIEVKVKPRAAASELQRDVTGAWFAHLRSPPSAGRANAELIDLVAKHFGCRKSAVSIKRGASSRLKLVKIGSA